jgi:hypothetical protein
VPSEAGKPYWRRPGVITVVVVLILILIIVPWVMSSTLRG